MSGVPWLRIGLVLALLSLPAVAGCGDDRGGGGPDSGAGLANPSRGTGGGGAIGVEGSAGSGAVPEKR